MMAPISQVSLDLKKVSSDYYMNILLHNREINFNVVLITRI